MDFYSCESRARFELIKCYFFYHTEGLTEEKSYLSDDVVNKSAEQAQLHEWYSSSAFLFLSPRMFIINALQRNSFKSSECVCYP